MSTSDKKSKLLPHQCRICNAPAEYSHFGVITCSSCKIFFRRNGNISQRKFTCNFDGHCEININTRHLCTACRLAKCLNCGMSCDLFRAPKRKEIKTKLLVQTSGQHRPELFPTINLLQSDTSLLTTNQWNLLSNLVNSFQESQLLSISQRLMDTNNVTFNTLIQEWIRCCYETTGIYLRLNDDLIQLTTDDRSIILRSAAENVSCMINALVIQNYPLCSLDAFSNTMISLYGKDAVDIHQSGMKFMDSDMIIIKLALSLFAFSEITFSYISTNLTNSLNILKIQNQYAEITWKYLLYKYGHYQAVQRFLNLICWLEVTVRYIPYVQNISLHVNDVNLLVEEIELKLLLDDVDRIIEVDEIC